MTDGLPQTEDATDRKTPARRWSLWILAPALLGVVAGLFAAMVPWARSLLGFTLILSGLAWLLRAASDWFAERAGPQRGVAMLGAILLGTWLVLAVSAPEPLRRFGFGTVRFQMEERDPYALPPARTKTLAQSLQQPSSEPLDPLTPLKDLVNGNPSDTVTDSRETPLPAASGQQGAALPTLRLSSATSVAGAGIVLIAEVRGDGRPVRGTVDFAVDEHVVASVPLRVQGPSSQAEYRLVGLKPGLYAIRAFYRGSRSFEAGQSAALPHRVRER